MKITILLEDKDNKFVVPTMIEKDGVENLNEYAHVFQHILGCVGFSYVHGVEIFNDKEETVGSSQDIMAMYFDDI